MMAPSGASDEKENKAGAICKLTMPFYLMPTNIVSGLSEHHFVESNFFFLALTFCCATHHVLPFFPAKETEKVNRHLFFLVSFLFNLTLLLFSKFVNSVLIISLVCWLPLVFHNFDTESMVWVSRNNIFTDMLIFQYGSVVMVKFQYQNQSTFLWYWMFRR